METMIAALLKAFHLIVHLDAELLSIILLSFQVSGLALAFSMIVGIPLGALVSLKVFPGRNVIIALLQTFMGLPPVVVGLFLYLLLSRSGPLGFMSLLYSPSAMVMAQTILSFPIVASLSHAAIVSVDPLVRQAATTLGATPFQASVTIIKEARYGILSAIIAGFGRVMAEVGAVLMVGGNIAGYTRVMTTTIALETDKGNFELGLALGIILLVIAMLVNFLLRAVQRQGRTG